MKMKKILEDREHRMNKTHQTMLVSEPRLTENSYRKPFKHLSPSRPAAMKIDDEEEIKPHYLKTIS